ncbi:MAG: NAD(P)-dependent oxidoreductase [Kiloniellales bacterium]
MTTTAKTDELKRGDLSRDSLPDRIADVPMLEELMTRPTPALREDLAALEGGILVLGASGKMGPTLCRLAKRAAPDKRILAVARFSDPAARDSLEQAGIETLACDVLDRDGLAALPDLPNVIYMAGRKFGSSGSESLTWAMNALAPALVAERFAAARIAALSTGCVYPFVDPKEGGCNEDVPPMPPPGDYAWSCLGRERMFEYGSAQHGTVGRLIRLNYAIDMRYGVLHDVGSLVLAGEAVDVTMGHANVIWQGDANSQILRSLLQVTGPTSPLNVTGRETLSIRELAKAFADRFDTEAKIAGQEAESAWLNDASQAAALFGDPIVPLERMIDWQADWLKRRQASLGKPTGFQVRDGKF